MTDLGISTGGERRSHSRATDNPIGLLSSIIAQNPKGSAREHIKAFKKLMLDVSYEDYAQAMADEWCRIKYTTAHLAAVPPTPEEIEERRKEREARRKAEAAAIERARLKLVGKTLEHVMANGKPLGECTGHECLAFGGWYRRIGVLVGARLVKEVLTNRRLKALARKLGEEGEAA